MPNRGLPWSECAFYVYPNAQSAKSLVDSHYAGMKRWLDKYIKEKRLDVACPTDLITALKYKDNLPNTSVDLISVNRKCEAMKEIKQAERSTVFTPLGRCAEF